MTSRAVPTYINQQAHETTRRPVSLPHLPLPDISEIEAKETAARFAECRVIREGLDSWREIKSVGSFENWKKVGAALLIGKRRALFVTGANRAWGRNYSREFNQWIIEHSFDHMPAPTRSVAIELAENAQAITAWRNSLPEKQRRRLINPQSVVKRWRASQLQSDSCRPSDKPSPDPQRDAMVAWHRFLACVEALPTDLAAPLKAMAIEFLSPHHCERDRDHHHSGEGRGLGV